MKLGPCTPIFRMFDVAKAREFYLDWLGFQVDFEHRFEPNAPLYMGLSKGDCKLHLSEHHGDGNPGLHARVQVDEVEAYHAQLIAAKYKYNRPGLQEQEWGTIEFTVYDPFGNRITFWRST